MSQTYYEHCIILRCIDWSPEVFRYAVLQKLTSQMVSVLFPLQMGVATRPVILIEVKPSIGGRLDVTQVVVQGYYTLVEYHLPEDL